jgi:hypothetical protein
VSFFTELEPMIDAFVGTWDMPKAESKRVDVVHFSKRCCGAYSLKKLADFLEFR